MAFSETLPDQLRGFVRHPIHLRDVLLRSQMWIWIPMTIETPGHRERFYLTNDIHLVDSSVARHATHAAIHMGAVVKVNIVWKIVDSGPFHGFTGRLTLSNRQQFLAVGVDRRVFNCPIWIRGAVTVHTGLRCRHGGVSGFVNGRVTISTIHFQCSDMQLMTEGDWLSGFITNIHRRRRRSVGPHGKHVDRNERTGDNQPGNNPIRPSGKVKPRHDVALLRCVSGDANTPPDTPIVEMLHRFNEATNRRTPQDLMWQIVALIRAPCLQSMPARCEKRYR